MISPYDVCHVVVATVPLYVVMSLAYASVKWWKIFTTEQCEGINKFVAKFSVPLLSFQVISSTNPYKMNMNLIYSDFLQKSMALLVLAVAVRVNRRVTMNWVITCFSLSTLPNTLIIGIPILKAMYRDEAESLLYQIVVLQAVVWNNLLLFLFELNAIEAVSSNPHVENSGEAAADDGQSKEVDQCVVATTRVKPMSILISVGKKLMINPNFHATLLGLIWAFIHFRVGVDLPEVVNKSILIMSTGGLGMAMFSLGLFMASQPSLISCGVKMALVAMALRFILGPALMAVSSIATGLRGTVFRVAVVQAALPQGIVPFVFAKEYDVHPDILSTGVIFGMVIALPIGLVYYSLLAL